MNSTDDVAPILDARGPDPRPALPAETAPGLADIKLVVDGGHAVVWAKGEIDVSSAPDLVAAGQDALSNADVADLTVDFSGVSFLDSSGLGAIVQLRKLTEAAGTVLTLRAVTPAVAKVFALTGLDKVFRFDVVDDGRC